MTTYYASDIIETSLRLAGIQTLNNFSWKDACALLNEKYEQTYQAITNKDPGLYSKIVRVINPLIEMPPHQVLRPVNIFCAQDPILPPRDYFRPVGNYGSRRDPFFYIRQGTSIILQGWPYYKPVWFEYIPVPKTITFCLDNRNPKSKKYTTTNPPPAPKDHYDFNEWSLDRTGTIGDYQWNFRSLAYSSLPLINLNDMIMRENHKIINVVADWPYCWVTTVHETTGRLHVYLYDNLPDNDHCVNWEPFAYQGKMKSLEVVEAVHDDYTGRYAIYRDFTEDPTGNTYYEVGWCPDTRIDFPLLTPYHMLVAQVANRIGMLQGDVSEAVQEAMASAANEFNNMVVPETSGWQTMVNVRPGWAPLDRL